jgi:hypothetical protein
MLPHCLVMHPEPPVIDGAEAYVRTSKAISIDLAQIPSRLRANKDKIDMVLVTTSAWGLSANDNRRAV